MLMTEPSPREALTDTVAGSARPQPYRFIHEALRALMFRTLRRVAALHAACADERAALQAAVDALLQVCADHLRWMARALDDAEWVALAGTVRTSLPPQPIAGVVGLLADELAADRRARLLRTLDLAAV